MQIPTGAWLVAFQHLRQRRLRQEHVDRAPSVRVQGAVRRSTAGFEQDSKKSGTRGGEVDYALLLDGLSAEREQGITIDVAYRFFASETRNFIVADTPATSSTRAIWCRRSTADLSLIHRCAQGCAHPNPTPRSSSICSHPARRLGVNKRDMVDYQHEVFERIEREYREFSRVWATLGHLYSDLCLNVDNVVERSLAMPVPGRD